MKNKKIIITLIIVLFVVILGIGVFITLIFNNKINLGKLKIINKTSNVLILDKYYENINSEIDIKSSISDVYVKEAKDDRIRLVIYGDEKESLNVSNEDKLKIVYDREVCVFFCFGQTKNKIEVYIPNNYDNKIYINNNYGNVKVTKKLKNIKIKEDYGNVEIFNVDNVKVNNNYGNIKIKKAISVDLEDDYGNIEVGTVSDSIIKNSYGNIKIDKINNYLDISDDCGEIKIRDVNITRDSKIKNSYGNVKINKVNNIYIDAKTDLGDIKIKNNNKKSDIKLKIENNCGNIKVRN